MVIMARYGPATRSAGKASSAPISPASRPASGSATQKLTPAVIRIAET